MLLCVDGSLLTDVSEVHMPSFNAILQNVRNTLTCLHDLIFLKTLTFMSPCIVIIILISNEMQLSQFILSGNCSTCFGWYLHPSSGAQTTVSTISGISHAVTVICGYRGRVGTGLSVLWLA
jgi:hypothetical protein